MRRTLLIAASLLAAALLASSQSRQQPLPQPTTTPTPVRASEESYERAGIHGARGGVRRGLERIGVHVLVAAGASPVGHTDPPPLRAHALLLVRPVAQPRARPGHAREPGGWEVTPQRAVSAGLDRLPEVLGEEAAGRFFSALEATDPHHHSDVPAEHRYLMVVGVSPEARGLGLGRALLRPVMERADAAGLTCSLETAQPDDDAFYEHLGFTKLVEAVEPRSGLRLWTFRRDPPAQATDTA
jgi:GNAT superfamily N-acetyltransferase